MKTSYTESNCIASSLVSTYMRQSHSVSKRVIWMSSYCPIMCIKTKIGSELINNHIWFCTNAAGLALFNAVTTEEAMPFVFTLDQLLNDRCSPPPTFIGADYFMVLNNCKTVINVVGLSIRLMRSIPRPEKLTISLFWAVIFKPAGKVPRPLATTQNRFWKNNVSRALARAAAK